MSHSVPFPIPCQVWPTTSPIALKGAFKVCSTTPSSAWRSWIELAFVSISCRLFWIIAVASFAERLSACIFRSIDCSSGASFVFPHKRSLLLFFSKLNDCSSLKLSAFIFWNICCSSENSVILGFCGAIGVCVLIGVCVGCFPTGTVTRLRMFSKRFIIIRI